jgi:sulfate adenylyltransferase subunit 2
MSNTRSVSVTELNARRRKAVRLRLQGQKLAAVAASTGLSQPTIISAVRAYRDGGWNAVQVSPRKGRPKREAEGIAPEHLHGLLQAMVAGPPDADGVSQHLWSRKAMGEWLKAHGGDRTSAGSMARLTQQLGLEFDDKALPPATESRWHGIEFYRDNIGFIVARDPRGQLLWLAFSGSLDAKHYVAFLERIAARRSLMVLAVPGSSRLARVPELREWLDAHSDSVRLIDPPSVLRAAPPPSPRPEGISPMPLTHLQRLEAESIHIMREVVAEADKPVMLYSIGKDSAVMLHLAMKAFYPSKPPFPLLHVDTRWKFRDMYAFRDKMVKELGLDLIVHINPEGVAKNINPFTHGSAIHTDVMKTEGLKQALDKFGFDAAFGGARRDEEKSRAKERIFSFRSAQHRWDPKNQRPELWKVYNARKHKGESLRVFPLSNWTELDIWQYIYKENIPIVPLYYAAKRPVVERSGTLIMVDDDRMPLSKGEVPMMRSVRFRTLGCYPLTGAIQSEAHTLPDIIQEMLLARTSERQGRVIDHDQSASMEKKKQEGYF